MQHFDVSFQTQGELKECVIWCRKHAIKFGSSSLDFFDLGLVDETNSHVSAGAMIFMCHMSNADFIKFKLRWPDVIRETTRYDKIN
jgi:hypothetical protein